MADTRSTDESAEWDLFLSYAAEDRDSFVGPLAELLREFGASVWWDGFELSLGDSLSRSIDRGLAQSRYGAVIVSPSFLRKRWPEYELRGLTAKEMTSGKTILPIWLGVSIEDVVSYSPTLADKKAIVIDDEVDESTLLKACMTLLEIIRPDVLSRVHRRIHEALSVADAAYTTVDTRKIRMTPPRHEELPDDLVGRIRLVRAALLPVYPHSMDYWVRGFRHDTHPSREVGVWERVATAFTEFILHHPNNLPAPTRRGDLKTVLTFLLGLSNGQDDPSVLDGDLREDADLLRALMLSRYPPLDFLDDLSRFDPDDDEDSSDFLPESFPDIPSARIEQLVQMVTDEMTRESPSDS